MTQYRKKPVVVDAFCLDGGPMPDWFLDARTADVVQTFSEGTGNPFNDPLKFAYIHTMEGVMRAERGDWIIRGIEGEMYPCKPHIFAATYQDAAAPIASDMGALLARWEARSREASPVDAMLVNKHVRELREACAAREVGWLPLDTAPKDRPILLKVKTTRNKWTRTIPLPGRWFNDGFMAYNHDEAVARVDATHWQELP